MEGWRGMEGRYYVHITLRKSSVLRKPDNMIQHLIAYSLKCYSLLTVFVL